MTTPRDPGLSLWLDQCADELEPGPRLDSSLQVDVAIVGGGYTGLWTAYYLKKADPSIRIAIVEAKFCGFGASGRNGGWCSALFAASKDKIARRGGRDAAIAMQEAMMDTVDEVERVCVAEGIDCNFYKGGTLTFATTPMQVGRVKHEVTDENSWGLDAYEWLEPDAARARIALAACYGAAYTPHCARIHPARLVAGLKRVVTALGVAIYEQTPATAIAERAVTTAAGTVAADVVVRATEGYTARMRNSHRSLLPLYSLMIATEPLPPSFWDEVGWRGCETFNDGRHLLIYAQRTADDRIAIGGRGAPYHFGSRIRPGFDHEPEVFGKLEATLHALFPQTAGAAITHRWGGCLGVPRDWYSSVGYDPSTGRAWAGGYVGDGVSTTNLAGRTLADLITGSDTPITRLPWVGHRSRNWEVEPLRWLGVNAGLALMGSADNAEQRTGKPSKRGALIKRLIGI